MANDRFSIPTCAKEYIKDQGYKIDGSMTSYIQQWWNWYKGNDSWYTIKWRTLDGKRKSRKRLSLRPHKKAAKEWASLLLNEDTEISVENPQANEWLKDYLDRNSFWPNGQSLIEKAWAIGTGAWALAFDIDEDDQRSRIRIRRYDARMIIPLTWDEEGVTECAFVSQITLKGDTAYQVQLHVVENGQYLIKTAMFLDGKKVNPEEYDVIGEFETGCSTPTFAIVKPGLDNTVVDASPYGMSVFADALDSAKAVDISFDAIFQEIQLTEAIVFLSDEMINVRDEHGKAVPVPSDEADRKFRKLDGQEGKNLYEVYSPDIRTSPIKEAFNVALAEFGDDTGFGVSYFALDEHGTGLKTATEVVSDNSTLMRNVKKHENSLRKSIQTIITSLLTCVCIHCGQSFEGDPGIVSVKFDDSIITDTQTEKNLMLAEISAGVVPKWKYLETFYGMSEEEAKAALPQETETILDPGF